MALRYTPFVPPFDISAIFHQLSKEDRGSLPKDPADGPAEWKTVSYKPYERMIHLDLEDGEALHCDLVETLHARSSTQHFSQRGITRGQLSLLLRHAGGLRQGDVPFRTYPSAGARFPLEVYAFVLAAGDKLPRGLYHYDVKHHRLDVLLQGQMAFEEAAPLFSYEWAQQASVALFITAIFSRTQQKYGGRGYRDILLEAGHLGQNICLMATALQLSTCPLAGTQDRDIERLLDIDGTTESLVHTVLLD